MAISASKSTSLTPSIGTGAYTLTAYFIENSATTSTNKSNITCTATLTPSTAYWSTSHASTLQIYWYDNKNNSNGTLVASLSFSGLSSQSDVKTASGTINVDHNTDGTLSGYARAVFTKGSTTSSYAPPSGEVSTNNTALTIIPRYTSVTGFSVTQYSETQLTFNWQTADTIDYAWYSTNNGSSWTGYNVADGTSGSFTIGGLSAGTTYSCKIKVRRKDSQLTTEHNATAYQTTYQYPYVNSVVTGNLKIGNQQEVKIYNPLGRNVTVYMKQNNTSGTQLYSGTTTASGTNASFKFTPNATTLYNSIPNGTSGNAIYYCAYSNQIVQTKSGTYYMDTNSSTFKPTIAANSWSFASNYINTNTIIKGKSSVTVTVSSSATPYTGASIVRYIVYCGSRSAQINGTTGSATITSCSDSTILVRAVDSRGYTQDSSKSISVIPYTDQTCTIDADRTDGVGSDVFLNLSGTYYNDKLYTDSSTQADNTILSIKYCVSTTTSYGTDTDIPTTSATISGGNYSLNNYQIYSDGLSAGFTIGTRYNIRIKVEDRLQTKEFYGTITDGKLAVDCYQDSEGDYHRGINGLGSDDYAMVVHGNVGVDRLYQISSGPDFLPSGNGTSPEFWCSLPNGTYFYASVVYSSTNMPSNYGYVTKDGYYTTDGGKGDFTVIFQQQATGSIWRTSGNGNTVTCTWRRLVYEDEMQKLGIAERGRIFLTDFADSKIGNDDIGIYDLRFSKTYTNPPIVITSFYTWRPSTYWGGIGTYSNTQSNTGCRLCIGVKPSSFNATNRAASGVEYIVISMD